jgi:sarcosine oxidase subunit gamma
MPAATRRSPLHDLLDAQGVGLAEREGMPAPIGTRAALPPVALTDASCLRRMGVKGPAAQAWLDAQGVPPPAGVNRWQRTADGVLVARLARTEFFLEDRLGGDAVMRLRAALAPAEGVYPVMRQDAALVLAGERANELLVQTCNVNFRAWDAGDPALAMTSMVGVSVLVLWQPHGGGRLYRIWCDGTFGPYLFETLLAIARELGGGPVGLSSLFPEFGAA